MAIVIDSSALIAGEHGDARALELLDGADSVALSAISVLEYWKGIQRAGGERRRQARLDFYERAVALFEIVPIGEEIAVVAAGIWAELEARGAMIPSLDLLIAATAVSREASLATLDAHHFAQVPGLEVISLSG